MRGGGSPRGELKVGLKKGGQKSNLRETSLLGNRHNKPRKEGGGGEGLRTCHTKLIGEIAVVPGY